MKEKWIPLEKRTKKQQKEYHAEARAGWNGFSPVTRVGKDEKKYSRRKFRAETRKAQEE